MHSQSLPLCKVDQRLLSTLQLNYTNDVEQYSAMLQLKETHKETAKWQYSEDSVQRKNLARRYEEKITLEFGKKNFLAHPKIRGAPSPLITQFDLLNLPFPVYLVNLDSLHIYFILIHWYISLFISLQLKGYICFNKF